MSMRWISSGGGPLILMEMRIARYWRGMVGLSASSSLTSDYWRACAIHDYVDVIAVGPGSGVVIADEPNPTTWVAWRGQIEGDLVRWQAAKSESDIIKNLTLMPDLQLSGRAVGYEITDKTLVLFDAGLTGDEGLSQSLQFSVGHDHFHIYSLPYRPEESTWLLIHRFVRVGSE